MLTIQKAIKLLGITIANGIIFGWMFGLGIALGVGTAFENTARACRLSSRFMGTGTDIIAWIEFVSAAMFIIAGGIDTFRKGTFPDFSDVGCLLRLGFLYYYGAMLLFFCFIPIWIGCSIFWG